MSHDLSKSAICYGLYDGGKIVAFIGVIHFPHPKNPKIKSCSRLCVLPDYQGIDIGKKFLTAIAEIYSADGWDFKITTSAKNLINALRNDDRWIMTYYGRHRQAMTTNKSCKKMNETVRTNCKTASFFYLNKLQD